jgi:hypothetical protein
MESNYVLERSVGGVWSTLATLPANVTAYADRTCVHDTYYEYRIKAIGSISDYSNTLAVQTLAKPTPNLSLVGFLSDIGSSRDVAVIGNRAYLASDPFGVVVLDVTNPSAPSVLGSQHPTGPAAQIAVVNGLAVAAGTPRGTDIVDVRDPAYPRVLSSVAGSSADVAASGSFAYLASGGDLKVVDLSDPYAARVVSTVVTPGIAYSVAVSGTKAVVADASSGISVVDIANPYSAYLAGTLQLSGTSWKAAAAGNVAYVATNNPVALYAVDISQAASPRVIGTISTGYSVLDVTVSGSRVFLSEDGSGMTVVDATNPASMRILMHYSASQVGTLPQGVCAANGLLYIAGNGLGFNVVNLTDVASPTVVGSLSQVASGYESAMLPSLNAAVVGGGSGGTDIIDLTLPDYPKLATKLPDLTADIAASGSFAYLASAGDLKVVDVSNPYAARVVSTVVTPGIAYGVAVSGTKAVVADASRGVAVVDVSNPYSAYLAGTLQLSGTAWKAAAAGNVAYVATSNPAALYAVDITQAASPRVIGMISTGYSILDVMVSGSRVFLSEDGSGMTVVDVTNPASMRILTHYSASLIGSFPQACTLEGDFLYVASNGMGLKVLDIESITSPVLVRSYTSPGHCQDVVVSGSLVVTADTKSEIAVYTK